MYANCKDEGTLKPDNLLAGDFPRIAMLVTITGGNYKRGAVLGKITESGNYKSSVSSSTDGSQVPTAILAESVNAESEDKQGIVYLTGEFNADSLSYDSGFTLNAITDKLREKSIFSRNNQA